MGGGLCLGRLVRDAEALENGREHLGFYAQSGGQICRGGVIATECEVMHVRDTAFCDVEAQAGVGRPDPAELPVNVAPGEGDASGCGGTERGFAVQGVQEAQKRERTVSEEGRAVD